MALSITGKVFEVGPERTGQSQHGTWSVRELIVEVPQIYNGQVIPKHVMFQVWNNKPFIPDPGTTVTVYFDIEARRSSQDGKWFDSVKAYKIETPAAYQQPAQAQYQQPAQVQAAPAAQPQYQQPLPGQAYYQQPAQAYYQQPAQAQYQQEPPF